MQLNWQVDNIKGVGNESKKLLFSLGVNSVEDLLFNFPRKYQDYSKVSLISKVQPGDVTVKGVLHTIRSRYVRHNLHITEAVIQDESGQINAVWFNQPYRARAFKSKQEYYFSGPLEFGRQTYQLMNPSVELVGGFPKNTARIVPVYKETKGLKSHSIRAFIKEAMPAVSNVKETLPPQVIKSEGLVPIQDAIRHIHFPGSKERLQQAKERIAFEEVFTLVLASLINKQEVQSSNSPRVKFDPEAARTFTRRLGFALTGAQKRAAWQILQDMDKQQPMNRLLEGDVGSGKTVVAIMAAYMCFKSGLQTVIMAPTEILARQHFAVVNDSLGKMGVSCGLLLGSQTAKIKQDVKKQALSGRLDVLIGTHAILQSDVSFQNVGLAVVDEQQRFGVKQRADLQKKTGKLPHLLSMTATPIPRSLALTVYGDLDVSIIDEMPPGRGRVITKLFSPLSRDKLYQKIDEQIKQERQVFVVCPLIAPSDTLGVRSVEAEYARLNGKVFQNRRMGLLHGKLKPQEKQEVIEAFRNGSVDILVSTTVVEVGVDIPNATVMLIEGAERFGLAQLHQLRGRVGRSSHQAYCFLVPSTIQAPSRRLREMELVSDGFKLAEIDLDIRGPGEIYGTRQHGALDLHIAKISDVKLVARARAAAQRYIDSRASLIQYPKLHKQVEDIRAIMNLN